MMIWDIVVFVLGVGAGVDSFYEYLLKSYLLFGDSEYYFIFREVLTNQRFFLLPLTSAFFFFLIFIFNQFDDWSFLLQMYEKAIKYMNKDNWYFQVDMTTGQVKSSWVDRSFFFLSLFILSSTSIFKIHSFG
jgi:hypothetical protein